MDSAAAREIEPLDDPARVPASSIARGVQLTSFIGRNYELTAVVELLDRGDRLVTITGPGGVGKTRLALAVLAHFEQRANRVRELAFVSLAPIADDALVIPTIARSLGVVAEGDHSPVDRLALALDGRPLLLVLDNLEHVVGAAVELSRLLNAAPDLVVLTTSRRALRLIGEQEFPLSPLTVPRDVQHITRDDLLETQAGALFVTRATAANPSFSITESNAAAVAQICVRLDGLPLAIELAAARVKLLSPQALLARLSGRLRLLTTGPRDVPARQQTLRDTIAWSYDLLGPDEQALFRTSAVFAGGFTLEAASAVASRATDIRNDGLTLLPDEVSAFPPELDTIAALVDHSLLVQEEGIGGEPRFRMLETIREYALEQLDSAGERDGVRDAHARYYLELAEQAANPEYTREESVLIRRLEPELDNVRAALAPLLDPSSGPERAELGLRLAGAMVRFWDIRGYLAEEAEWLERALDGVPVANTSSRGVALTALGVNAWFTDNLDRAVEWQQQALAVWQALDERKFTVRSLWFLALVAGKRHEIERLEHLGAQARPLVPDLETTLWEMVPNSILALAALAKGDGSRARALFEETLDFHARNNYLWPHAWVLGMVAESVLLQGDRASALRFHQQSLEEFQEHGDIYATLDGIAAVAGHAISLGQTDAAVRLLGAIAAVRPAVGHRVTWNSISEEDVLLNARSALNGVEFKMLFAEGQATSLEDAVAFALAIEPVTPLAMLTQVAVVAKNQFGLSPRELDVLRLLTEGKSNDDIGAALFISPRTASTHVANILGKLGVNSRSAAVAIALKYRQV